MSFNTNPPKVLNYDTLPENVKTCEYAVRGELYNAAQKRVQSGKEVIFTNVGNPHGLGQKPITFMRQVFSLLSAPFLLESPDVHKLFPADAIARAKKYLKAVPGGVGAYSDSKGLGIIRQEYADFLNNRDNTTGTKLHSSPDNIFLCNGASEAVRLCLQAMLRGPQDGVLVPIPQYPLYSAAIQLLGGSLVGYYLDEEKGWTLDFADMERSLADAKRKGVTVRGLVFINPGNPTGQVLTEDELRKLIDFCHRNQIVLLADEVYQDNIYQNERKFISARSVLNKMGEPYISSQELISFHTASKGVYGECGFRGGAMEFINIDGAVAEELYKLSSINLSPNVPGQFMFGLMINGPKVGDLSYPKYAAEKQELRESLTRRAKQITNAFNSCEGITCQSTDGAMYSFPQIFLPAGAVEEAKRLGKSPDVFYCLKLLEETGISTVPGSGFQQKNGSFHFRTTILPLESKFDDLCSSFIRFHQGFMNKYGGNGSSANRTTEVYSMTAPKSKL
jgi:glutamate--glyoxylate aminotransferase